MDLADFREDYVTAGLDITDVNADPLTQFERWFSEVEQAGLWEPNAMVVSAVDADGWPTSRFVLLKEVDQEGFIFFTNYESNKALALDHSGRAALTFGWHQLRRQVRVQGLVSQLPAERSDAYFARRPRGSQLSAWASPQSRPVDRREILDERYADVERRFADREIPRPPNWGGYLVRPNRVEFWQGRPNRFHDRVLYMRRGDQWELSRLAP